MYSIDFSAFFSSAFSVDCIIFGFSDGEIKALLIKRSVKPFENYWAVPGDLVYPNEDLPQAAERILFELTGLKNIQLPQSQTFGKPNRHPQGRVITIAFFALIRIEDFEVKVARVFVDILQALSDFDVEFSFRNDLPILLRVADKDMKFEYLYAPLKK